MLCGDLFAAAPVCAFSCFPLFILCLSIHTTHPPTPKGTTPSQQHMVRNLPTAGGSNPGADRSIWQSPQAYPGEAGCVVWCDVV